MFFFVWFWERERGEKREKRRCYECMKLLYPICLSPTGDVDDPVLSVNFVCISVCVCGVCVGALITTNVYTYVLSFLFSWLGNMETRY